MKKQKSKNMMLPPAEKKLTVSPIGTTAMIVPPTEAGLITPPKPMTAAEMLKVSGGSDQHPTPGADIPSPPEMKVVELKDGGGFVSVPENAIFKTEEEAKNFKPPFPHEPHHHPQQMDQKHHKHHFSKP